MWLCMIFTVWPMRMGLLGLRQGVWGGQRIISVGCLEDNKALEAREGVSTWLDHRDPQDGRNGFVRLENAQCGQEVQGFYIGRVEAKRHIVGLWLQKGLYQP